MALQLRMLGPFEVLVDGATVPLPPSRKTRALLAWLALADRPQRRERLCDIFWDIPDDPKGALRWSLSKIRRIVGESEAARLKADRSAVTLDTDGVAIDAARVLRLSADGIAALPTSELEGFAASFRGGFVEDLALDRCPDYEAWRTALAFEAETAQSRILAELVERLTDEPARALPYAERLAVLSPDGAAAAAHVDALRRAVRESVSAGLSAPSAPETVFARVMGPAAAGDASPAASAAAQPGIRYATARDGTRIAWTQNGEGPPLVRAAHWMSHLAHDRDSAVWRHWVRELSSLSTLVRYDERCNGLSDWEAEDLSLDAFVGDLEAVVDAAELERFTLLGISQSCAISVAYALRHPERVAGLILYGGYAQGWRARGNPEEIALREAIMVLMRDGWGHDNSIFRELFVSRFVPGATREQMAQYSELQRQTISPRNAVRLQNAFGLIDVLADLGRVAVPTLVIHARGDQVAPIASGRALADGIPGARFVEVESANHILLEDEPAFGTFVAEIRGFLREVSTVPAAAGAEPTRRRVTVLDAEVVSPLAAIEALGGDDPVAASGLDEAMRACIAAHGGLVINASLGILCVAFGAVTPTEVHVVDACRAALALRDLVAERTEGSARLRVGIDTGDAVLRGLVVGGALPRRARQLNQALRSAVIALSDEAAAAAGGYLSFSAIRSHDIAGGRRGRRIFELKGLRDAPSRWHMRAERRLTAFTGRTAELELMMRCLGMATAGQGRTIFVSGEPGVGKSRLAQEFLSRCPRHGASTAEAGALEFDRNVPFAMLRRLLAGLLRLDPADARSAEAVGAALEAADARALSAAVLFALDLPVPEPGWDVMAPAERAHRVREALRRIVAMRARERPLVVVAEDLHWCDDASLAAIARLVEGLERLPVVLLATARPEFHPDWLQRSAVKPVNLDVLDGEHAHKLVRTLVGRHPSVGTLRRLLIERTDGTPLMIEETVGSLIQAGRLIGKAGAYVAREPIVDVETVTSVAPVIAARIERLEPPERQLLQLASVIGRDGPLDLLAVLTGLASSDFDAALRGVERAELLFELLGGTEPAFTFKHALVRDAAYASMPEERRRELHGRAFTALVRGPAGAREGLVESLAHHAYLAGELEQAVAWLMRAADRAIERSAYDRAVASLERAAGALEALDPTPAHIAAAIDVRMAMQIAYASLGNFEAATVRIGEACKMAEDLGDDERLAHALLKLAYTCGTCGRLDEALEAAARLAAHSAAAKLDLYACEADLAAGFALLMRGDARAALARLAPHARRFKGAQRHERFGLLNTRSVWLNGCLAQASAMLGDLTGAEAAIAQALAVARETGRPQDRHASLQFALQVEIARGPSDRMLAEVETVLADKFDEWLFPAGPWLLGGYGEALRAKGRLEPAGAVLERAYEAADTAGMRGIAGLTARLLTALHAQGGDAAARAELEESLRTDPEIPVWLQTRMRRVLAATADHHGKAVSLLREAIAQAREAGLMPDEARCLAELAARLAASDPDAAGQAKRDAEALDARMRGQVAAE